MRSCWNRMQPALILLLFHLFALCRAALNFTCTTHFNKIVLVHEDAAFYIFMGNRSDVSSLRLTADVGPGFSCGIVVGCTSTTTWKVRLTSNALAGHSAQVKMYDGVTETAKLLAEYNRKSRANTGEFVLTTGSYFFVTLQTFEGPKVAAYGAILHVSEGRSEWHRITGSFVGYSVLGVVVATGIAVAVFFLVKYIRDQNNNRGNDQTRSI